MMGRLIKIGRVARSGKPKPRKAPLGKHELERAKPEPEKTGAAEPTQPSAPAAPAQVPRQPLAAPKKASPPKKSREEQAQEFFKAAERGDYTEVERLYRQNPWVEGIVDGKRPLAAAAKNGHVDVVHFLIEKEKKKYQAESPDKRKSSMELYLNALEGETANTALCLAAANGHGSIVGLLVKAGANMEWGNRNWNTPLLLAAKNGHGSVVKLLLFYGANPNHLNKEHKSALDLAIESKDKWCKKHIKKSKGKKGKQVLEEEENMRKLEHRAQVEELMRKHRASKPGEEWWK